jgi:hypothetical protein
VDDATSNPISSTGAVAALLESVSRMAEHMCGLSAHVEALSERLGSESEGDDVEGTFAARSVLRRLRGLEQRTETRLSAIEARLERIEAACARNESATEEAHALAAEAGAAAEAATAGQAGTRGRVLRTSGSDAAGMTVAFRVVWHLQHHADEGARARAFALLDENAKLDSVVDPRTLARALLDQSGSIPGDDPQDPVTADVERLASLFGGPVQPDDVFTILDGFSSKTPVEPDAEAHRESEVARDDPPIAKEPVAKTLTPPVKVPGRVPRRRRKRITSTSQRRGTYFGTYSAEEAATLSERRAIAGSAVGKHLLAAAPASLPPEASVQGPSVAARLVAAAATVGEDVARNGVDGADGPGSPRRDYSRINSLIDQMKGLYED